MKLIKPDELADLTTLSGGRFSVDSIESAFSFCKSLTTSHYENFPVGSILIPKKFRKHFYSVYSFARIADDIADESDENSEKRIQYLDNLQKLILNIDLNKNNNPMNSKNEVPSNPVILALAQTMKERNIPSEPFLKLLIAFKRDIYFKQPENFDELEDYCHYSANPIGELVLRIFGLYNDTTKPYSDAVCTGLQLVNFWQDLSIDLAKGRCYIPHSLLQKYGLTNENLHLSENKLILTQCLNEIYEYTNSFFIKGRKLFKYLKFYRLKIEIIVTVKGGEKLLGRIRKMNAQIFVKRPELTKFDFFKILISSF
ncbi:MAG: squalene synthase HpnC [bacterium]